MGKKYPHQRPHRCQARCDLAFFTLLYSRPLPKGTQNLRKLAQKVCLFRKKSVHKFVNINYNSYLCTQNIK